MLYYSYVLESVVNMLSPITYACPYIYIDIYLTLSLSLSLSLSLYVYILHIQIDR